LILFIHFVFISFPQILILQFTEPLPVREPRPPKDEEQAKITDLLTTKTGGAYIPPAKLRMMMAKVANKQSCVSLHFLCNLC
jgi:hypothetical protein